MTEVVTKPALDYENLQFHPLANIFSLIEGNEFDAFVDTFRRQGLLIPITLHEGQILGGRNRYRAGKATGYKFTAKDFTELPPGKDPKEYVYAETAPSHYRTETGSDRPAVARASSR